MRTLGKALLHSAREVMNYFYRGPLKKTHPLEAEPYETTNVPRHGWFTAGPYSLSQKDAINWEKDGWTPRHEVLTAGSKTALVSHGDEEL